MLRVLKKLWITFLFIIVSFLVCYSIIFINQFYFNQNFIPEVNISKELNLIQKEKISIISNLNVINTKEELSDNDKISSILNLKKLSELKELESNLLKEKRIFDSKILQIKKNTSFSEKVVFLIFISLIIVAILWLFLKKWYLFWIIWILYLFFSIILVVKDISTNYYFNSYLHQNQLENNLYKTNIYKNFPQYEHLQKQINLHKLLEYKLNHLEQIWNNISYRDAFQEICWENEYQDILNQELLMKSCWWKQINSIWKIINSNKEDWSVVYKIKLFKD